MRERRRRLSRFCTGLVRGAEMGGRAAADRRTWTPCRTRPPTPRRRTADRANPTRTARPPRPASPARLSTPPRPASPPRVTRPIRSVRPAGSVRPATAARPMRVGPPAPPYPRGAGSESGWSPRLVRLGAPRPGPAARRANRFGVPLVPLLVAALVATAFLAARGGTPQGVSTGGRPGGAAIGAPVPAVSDDGRTPEATPSADGGPAGTRTRDTGAHAAPRPPTRRRPAPPVRSGPLPPERARPRRLPPPGAPSRPARPPQRRAAVAPRGPSPSRRCASATASTSTATRRAPPSGAPATRRTGPNSSPGSVSPASGPPTRRSVRRPRCCAVNRCAARPHGSQAGTRWTTFVQYPYRTSYLLGSDTVACSLAAPSAIGGRISHRLQ